MNTITQDNFTKINNDVNGNPRYVIHFLDLLNDDDVAQCSGIKSTEQGYNIALKKSRTLGGKKYDVKAYGGGIVFQSYNLPTLVKQCNNLKTA